MKRFLVLILLSLNLISSIYLHAQRGGSQKPKAILIGAIGKQGQQYFNLLKDQLTFTAFVISSNVVHNINQEKFLKTAKLANIEVFRGVEEFEQALNNKQIDFEIALIVVPHHLHKLFTILLLKNAKIIIKEKPLALNSQEVINYEKVSKLKILPLFTIVQRHFASTLIEAKSDLHLIGEPLSFSYEYYFNLQRMSSGWRADSLKSGGGVVLDMGYHIIDVVNDFFGLPCMDTVKANFYFYYEEMLKKQLEDKAVIDFNYSSGLQGTIKLSRHHDYKKEEFVIIGTLGVIKIKPTGYVVYDLENTMIKSYQSSQTKRQNKVEMLNFYINNRHNKNYIKQELGRHKENLYFIDHIYKIALLNNCLIS